MGDFVISNTTLKVLIITIILGINNKNKMKSII